MNGPQLDGSYQYQSGGSNATRCLSAQDSRSGRWAMVVVIVRLLASSRRCGAERDFRADLCCASR